MSKQRCGVGLEVLNNLLHAVGGHDGDSYWNNIERFDHQTNQWSPVVAMNSRRSGIGLAAVNNHLMAIGRFDGAAYLKSLELYDSESNSYGNCMVE